ncbi:unnamed protein product [Calypogeia fissa]
MGDARRIDHLRALALSSMPSLASRRPAQRRNPGSHEKVGHRRSLVSVSSSPVIVVADDKEEGELSSDDEIERAATPLAAVESSLSFSHRNAGLTLRAPPQEKEERHTSAAASADSVPLVGVTTASVFSTSTRVSIVNKSQLFSAFTAQAPPLTSSQPLEPVHSGLGAGLAVRQHKHAIPEVNSSVALRNNSGSNPYHGRSENSFQASSTAASHLKPTPPQLSRSLSSGNACGGETIASTSLTGGFTGFQIRIPSPTPALPGLRLSDPPTAVPAVTRAVSAVPVSPTASAGADALTALGTTPAFSHSPTPSIGAAGRNEAGVRKEAEAFLASLRIPLSNSAAAGDANEDAFVIKFDEDSESDGEDESRTNPSRRNQGRGSQKGNTSSTGRMSTSVPLQSNPVIPTQSPADLTAEIDRMKKQIAAMERSKGKPSISSVQGKPSRVLPADIQRNMLPPATESRPSNLNHLAAPSVRPGSVDLESMRLKIAAKESELQQQRQRLAVKVPESSKGVRDSKRNGGVLAPSLPPTRSSQGADSGVAYAGISFGKSSSEKGTSGYRKEQARADGIPALALAGPAGASLASFKKDSEQRGLDGSGDHQHSNGLMSNFATSQVGSHVGRILHQPASKGMKRSRPEEGRELAKVPRWDKNSVSEKDIADDSVKEATLPRNANDTLKGGRSLLSSVQTAKRKPDAAQISFDILPQGFSVNRISAAGSEAVKKPKPNSSQSGGEELLPNSKQNVAQDVPSHDKILSAIFPTEKSKSSFPRSSTSLRGGSTPDVVDGNIGIRDAVSLSAQLPVLTEHQKGSIVLTSSNAIQQLGTTGNAEALPIQQAGRGLEISTNSPPTFEDTLLAASVSQPNVMTREFEQAATCTTVAVTECQQATSGRLNEKHTFPPENNRVQTTQPLKPVDPVPSASLDHQVEDSFHAGHSRIDNQQLDGEHVTFQQLLDEEELLDKQLEDVQRIRQQCEVRERIARREYREAQWALRAANADCDSLNQRRESLLSRIHAAEARHLSGKLFADRPLIPFGGTAVIHNQNRPERCPLPLVSTHYTLPVSQPVEGSLEGGVNVGRDRSALVWEGLSPSSSDKGDLAAVSHRDSESGLLAEEGEQNFLYKSCTNVSSDNKEQESPGQLIVGVESSGQLASGSPVGEREVQIGVVSVGSQIDLEPGVLVDGASQAENQCYARAERDLNNDGSGYSPSADLDNTGPGVSNLSAEVQYNAVSMAYASDTRADEVPHVTSLEESVQMQLKSLSWITLECSEQTAELCSVGGINSGLSRLGGLSAVCEEDDRYSVPAQPQVPRLDLPQVTRKELVREDSDRDRQDVEQIGASNLCEDARADLMQDLDTTDVQESVSAENVNVIVEDTSQDDSTGDASPEVPEHVLPIHFKDSSRGASAIEFGDADCHVEVGLPDVPDVVADSMFKEYAGQVLPERSSLVQEAVFLERGTKALESSAIGRAHSDDVPLDLESESVLCPISYNPLEASGARGGVGRSNGKSSSEAADNNGRLMTESQQYPSHLPQSAINTLEEEETNPNDGDNTRMETSDAPHLDVDEESPVIFSFSPEAPTHSDAAERKPHTIDESTEQGDSPKLLHADSTTDDPTVPDLEMQHSSAMESSERVAKVQFGDVSVAIGEAICSAAKQGNFFFSLQEEVDRGVLREDCVGGSESTDFRVENFITEQSPMTVDHVGHNLLITQNHYCPSPSERGDIPYDNSSVTKLAESGNLNKTGLQGCSDSLEEHHLDGIDFPLQINLKMTCDDNSTSVGSDYTKEFPVVEGESDLPMASDMITDKSEVLSQEEFGSQDQNPTMSVVAEEHMSECGEQKLEESEKESKGADVEVFRKALLDENMFERRATSGEVADATNLRKQNRNEVSKQVLPQLQQHRLEHLLDMVEVRVPELSRGGDILIQEVLHDEKDAGSPVAVDDLQVNALILETHDLVGPSGEQALSSRTTSEHVCDTSEHVTVTAKHWVPSADSLAVLRFIPTVQAAEAESGCEIGRISSERALEVSFGNSEVPAHRYESPLSIFRSCSFCPQLSDNLHLSRTSITWSHAINPFKPLCKFEHRGKCNNEDCPWQHADDYTLISDDQDEAARDVNKDREFVTSCASLPTRESPAKATRANARLAGAAKSLLNWSMWPVSSRPTWNDNEVPIYRTGSYVLRAEEPTRMCLLSHNLQLDREVESSHSFVLSPSIHRPLPSDIPCLLDASDTPSWSVDVPAYHPGSPHWRYVRDIQEKLLCSKDGLELQEQIDEEMWLEMALHHIDYDLSTDNNKARDQALFYLSRALESKPSSVTVWVVYACLFHMRKDNPEKDDMFHHAVQYNPASYELWVLYINSRSDFQSRLEAYEKAIVALADEGTQQQLDKEELSACLLDLGLQMLYFWCVSGCSKDSFVWVDDLISEASAHDYGRPHRGSTRTLLSHLTRRDACVMWITCTYLLACKHLPNSIITRLGCRQELPDGLEWENHAVVDELSRELVLKALNTAASESLGCLSLGSTQAVVDTDNFSKQVLGVNYIQCLALYEGLDSAACLGKKLISLHPTSLELIVVCARIEEHRNGGTTGLHVFEEAVSQWPHDLPGMQRLWNQYAGHALLWGGKDMAKTVLLNCAATKNMPSITELEVSQLTPTKVPLSPVSLDKSEGTDNEGNAVRDWSHLREYFVTLTSACKRSEGRTSSCYHLSQVEDTVFAWINLALVEALGGEIAASQSAINSAMKVAISYQDLRHCWRELAAQHVLCTKSAGQGDSIFLEHGMLSLLDRCKTDSYNLSELRSLSQTAFQDYKKPHVRKFLEDLTGPPPLDHSVLNSILETLYGPQMLPSGSYALKELFHFAEGILEALPGNVLLASSLCKIVGQNRSFLKRMYMPAVMWASALLVSSLHQSCPVAPEAYWVEAGSLLKQLDEERSLEEFYKLALLRYPFSAAIRQCLREVHDRPQVTDTFSPVVYNRSLELVVAEPMQVAVEC